MSVYASVLELDRKAVRELRITDPYSIHRVVYSLYAPPEGTGTLEAGRILYCDQGGDFHTRKILLLADRKPGDAVEGQYGVVRTREVNDDFLNHDHYRFRIVINPTKRDAASGKIVSVKGRDGIAAWFADRAPRWGFEVDTARLQIERTDVLRFRGKEQHSVTIAQAHVQGELKVGDRAQFRNSFINGIGRGRAFGCGLLQIVPIPDHPFA